MNRIGMAAATVAAMLTFANRPLSRQEVAEGGAAEQQIIRMERELAEAAMRRDVALLDRYTADDFMGIDQNGQELTKTQILARFAIPGLEVEALRHEDIRVRVYGECAIATAHTVLKARYNGQDVSGEFPYLRVWIRRQGRWQGVAAMSTTMPKRNHESP